MSELTTPVMGADDARRLTERIRITATNARESLTKLQELVEEAQHGQAHVALGYRSWQAYIADVFGDEPMQLRAPEERREIVQWLTAEGMPPNAIAPVVGVTRQRVSQIRAEIEGASDLHPERGPLTLTPEVAEAHTESVNRGITHVQRERVVEREERRTVTGMDGKTYTRPAPPPEPTPAAPEVIAPREFKPEPKPGTDLHALRYVVIPALNAWADEWTHKTLLDNTVTAEEAAQLLRDLSRTTPVLSQIRRLLNSRTESIK